MLHNKFWQGFFALSPLISLIGIITGYLVFVFTLFSNIPEMEHGNPPPMEFWGGLSFFIFMVFFMIFISIGSLIFYIMHAIQNPNLKKDNMILVWVLIFIFVGGIGQLIYWLIELVGKRKNNPPTSPHIS
jgi:peptidoglycan/LPS O-acetylase OafA/YrhL